MSPIHLLGDERVRFISVGAWNTLVGYLLFIGAHALLKTRIGPTGILLASYCISLPHAFLMQRTFVFRLRGRWLRQFARFAFANSAILVANLVLLPLAIHSSHGHPVLVQGVLIVVLTIASYLAHKHFSFASSK